MEGARLVTVKAVRYEPVGDELSGSIAMMQAAATIDAAVALAVESKNIDKLMDAAAMWIGLAERLGVDTEEDEDDLEDSEKAEKVFGFSSTSLIDKPIKEVIAENERTDDEE
jgi:hypothetical protein